MRQLLLAGALALTTFATGSFAQTMTPPSAVDYVTMAGQSDAFEIQSGQLAAKMGMSPDVKRFGSKMVTDHQKSTMMVMAAVRDSGLPAMPPPSLRPDQKAMLTQLKGETGATFDKDYVSQQLKAHQDALDLQMSYAQGGDDSNLKSAAAKIVPVVQMHLSMLKAMPMAGM